MLADEHISSGFPSSSSFITYYFEVNINKEMKNPINKNKTHFAIIIK